MARASLKHMVIMDVTFSSGREVPKGPLLRPVLLIVDDDRVNHTIMARALSDFAGTVIHATDGLAALRIATETRPDLIITAALLPKLDGRELAKMIKTVPATLRCKIVVMTALHKGAEYRREALRDFMVDQYLYKPVLPSTIRSLANQAARVSRMAS